MEAEKRPVLRALLIAVLVLAAAAAGAGLHALITARKTSAPPKVQPASRAIPTEKVPVNLYFGDTSGPYLSAEERVLVRDTDPLGFARTLVEALLLGPAGSGRVRVIPEGTRLLAVHMPGDGLCVVDFSSDLADGQPGSVNAEALTAFSVVDTLALNMEDVSRVQILVAGQPPETLAGHLGASAPFSADMALIR